MTAAALSVASPAFANCMTCRKSAVYSYDNPIPVWVNTGTFCGTHYCNGGMPTNYCYAATEVVNAIENAVETWNRSGANIRFRYVAETINTDPCDLGDCSGVVVQMTPNCASNAGDAWVDNLCGKKVIFNAARQFRTTTFAQHLDGDIWGFAVHELGHILGMMHPCDCSSTTNNTVMGTHRCVGQNDQGLTLAQQTRHLWQQDFWLLRHHAQYGYGEKQNARVRLRYSTNGFASHYPLNDPEDYANHRPAVTYGPVFSGAVGVPYYVVASAQVGYGGGYDLIRTRRGDGASAWTNSEFIGAWTNHGLAAAAAPGTSIVAPTVFVLLHVGHSDDRRVHWQTSNTGQSWTSPQGLSDAKTSSPPGAAWSGGAQRFVFVRGHRQNDGALCFRTSTVCGGTICGWTADTCLNTQRAIGSPAIVCDPTTASRYCRVSYRDGADVTSDARIRTRLVYINTDGSVSDTGVFTDTGGYGRSSGPSTAVLLRSGGGAEYLQVFAQRSGASGLRTGHDANVIWSLGGAFGTQFTVQPFLDLDAHAGAGVAWGEHVLTYVSVSQ